MENHEQIGHWFVQYSEDIYKFLVYYTGKQDVEDFVQDVFLKVLKSSNSYEGRANPKTWLFSIARNVAIDYQRKQQVLQFVPDTLLQFFSSKEKTPYEAVQMNEDIALLYHGIQKLKPHYRDVLILRGINGFSVSETAQILDWNESKVNLTLHRASKALKKILKNDNEEELSSNENMEK